MSLVDDCGLMVGFAKALHMLANKLADEGDGKRAVLCRRAAAKINEAMALVLELNDEEQS